jgi:signal transduction histidine kinase/integral membrane sensor domain MASE1
MNRATAEAPLDSNAALARALPLRRGLAIAVAVGVSYYLGTQVGFVLRFPPLTPSVVWPPNSILTATLLLVAPRRWWICLLGALPAHVIALHSVGWMPSPAVLGFFVTNCSEAMIGAGIVRWFSDAPNRLDSLWRVSVFIVGAAVLGTFLSSFADSWVASHFLGNSYWTVFRTRFFSNVLTELTLPPVILGIASIVPLAQQRTTVLRRLEAIILAVALVSLSMIAFAPTGRIFGQIPGAPRTLLAFLLPFLLWATVRFGPFGVSSSMLATTLVAIWGGASGGGTFNVAPNLESVMALQLFLVVVAIPLMCLAAVIEERRSVGNALEERLRFEQMLARVSAAFVHWPSHDIDFAIGTWLRRLGEFLGIERIVVLRIVPSGERLVMGSSWAAHGFESPRTKIAEREVPRAIEKLLQEKPFVFEPWASPDEALRDELELEQGGHCANVTIPLVASGRVMGGMAFDSLTAPRPWPEAQVRWLQQVAEVFANALARKETEDALRASEAMKSAILTSLTSAVAVLDREGRIIAVNTAWTRYAHEPGTVTYAGDGVGTDYLEICRRAVRENLVHSAEVLSGLERVLAGEGELVDVELSSPLTNSWFTLYIVALERAEGGAVISYTDISERKRAEMQAERMRQELAHFTRISTMGELTASIAHELRQPLAGILTNAQAARRFLELTPPDLNELRSILDDIIADDRRAAEVITRLRDILSKGELRQQQLDLNDLIRDVARLLGSDTIIRNMRISLELHPHPVVVSGDRVQLEQVLLNLVVNAMDAMAETPNGQRTVMVRTERMDGSGAHVAVEDAGTGLANQPVERLFEPFYTTKPAGMGMGLSVAKSIVEAHGGIIWATNNPTRGATFHFALPWRQKDLS